MEAKGKSILREPRVAGPAAATRVCWEWDGDVYGQIRNQRSFLPAPRGRSYIFSGDPPRRSLLPVAREPRGEVHPRHTHRGAAGPEPPLRVPRPAPPGAGSGDRSGSREAAAGRSRVCGSRVSPACRSRGAAAAVRAAAVSRVRAEARACLAS